MAAVKDTFEDLALLLRQCPAEHLPATTTPDSPPGHASIVNRQSQIVNTTKLGTPRARTWDDAWLAVVDAAEARIGRRICGARTVAGNPCELGSTHANGRCKFHGGFDLTGAPPGNRYACIHGLYSRRLKTCGDHCAQWASCPCAGPEVENIPLPDRPVCPYEQAQYNTALADALDLAQAHKRPDPFHVHIAHDVALLHVMLNRAALELRNQSAVNETLAAMTRIANELRKFLAILSKGAPADIDIESTQQRRRILRNADPGPEPQHFEHIPPDEKEVAKEKAKQAETTARKTLARAVAQAAEDSPDTALRLWQEASRADPNFTAAWTSSLRKRVRAQQRNTTSTTSTTSTPVPRAPWREGML